MSPSLDLSLEDLWRYQSEVQPPDDFDVYWRETIAGALSRPLDAELQPFPEQFRGVEAFELTFAGATGGRVTGWYVQPGGRGPHGALLHLHGYGGRAARPLELYPLAANGVAVLSVECRAQSGDGDGVVQSGPSRGWLTSGLTAPGDHYYTTIYCDIVRATEILARLDDVDEARIGITGPSQGGGLTIAAAALTGRACAAWADVPFLCDIPRAIQVATKPPYTEIPDLLRVRPDLTDVAFRTLAYIDAVNLAPKVTCPIVLTAALWDDVCPPSTIFGAYRKLSSEAKEIRILPFNRHELGQHVEEERFRWLIEKLA